MFNLVLILVLLIILALPVIKRKINILQIPGPIIPKSIKGNLLDMVADPRQFGHRLSSKHGPIYRIYTSNFGMALVISDPSLAKKLYQNQANMAHAWDQGLGHYIYRFIGKFKINQSRDLSTCYSQSLALPAWSELGSGMDFFRAQAQPLFSIFEIQD